MKIKLVILKLSIGFLFFACSQDVKRKEGTIINNVKSTSMTDSALIKNTGADEFGYKQYALIFLTEGPNKIDSADVPKYLAQHMAHLKGLIESKKVVFAGPLLADVRVKGITVFSCPVEEAKLLSEEDPAVKGGYFGVEAYPWYGPATLMNIPENQKQVETRSVYDIFK